MTGRSYDHFSYLIIIDIKIISQELSEMLSHGHTNIIFEIM